MSFIDTSPDLAGTRFSREDLQYAQGYLHHLIERHLPEWLSTPQGYVGVLWESGSQYAACHLIHLSQVLFRANKLLGRESVPFLIRKTHEILTAPTERTYTEAITELEVVWFFYGKAEIARLEPTVPVDLIDAPNRPPGPDLGLKVSGQEVHVEVTVMHFGELDRWSEAVAVLTKRFETALIARNVSRHITLDLPLGFQDKNIPRRKFEAIARVLVSEPEGDINLGDYGLLGRIWWKDPFNSLNEVPFGKYILGGPGIEIGFAMVTNKNLVAFQEEERTDAEEALIRSFRATLDRKKSQLTDRANMLIVRLGHHRLEYKGFGGILHQRIWPNPRYAAYSAIALYKPPGNSRSPSDSALLSILRNPNASLPLPEEVG